MREISAENLKDIIFKEKHKKIYILIIHVKYKGGSNNGL